MELWYIPYHGYCRVDIINRTIRAWVPLKASFKRLNDKKLTTTMIGTGFWGYYPKPLKPRPTIFLANIPGPIIDARVQG